MKQKKWVKMAAAAVVTLTAVNANALELWEPQLPGVTIGVPAGALPGAGAYFDLENYYASYRSYNNAGNKVPGVSVNANIIVPVGLWVTGHKILGADYAVQVVQPIVYSDLGTGGTTPNNGGHWGTFNTLLTPVILGWHLPNDFHVKSAFTIGLPSASSYPGNTIPGQLGSGNGYTSFIPNVGASWLHDGWNVSANMFYSFATKNNTTNYQSGQILQGDYTVAKSINKWTVGVGGFSANQITGDSGSGATAAGCVSNNGCKEIRFAIGPLVNYTFDGGVTAKLIWTEDVRTVNAVGGTHVQLGLFVPL